MNEISNLDTLDILYTLDTLDTLGSIYNIFFINYCCQSLAKCLRWKWVRIRGVNPSWSVEIFFTPWLVSISVTFSLNSTCF